MKYPTLGEIISASATQDNLGTNDRATIIDYLERALDLAQWKANFNAYIGTMDICADECGVVTFPFDVEAILACNVGGFPAYFRNSWFEYHLNGVGSIGMNSVGPVGAATNYTWDDRGYVPTIQDVSEWSYLAALVEDPVDGNGALQMQVFGETMDQSYNAKDALTIPVSGPSTPGVFLNLLNGYAATDAGATLFRKITRVIKPITRGYVKLMAFPSTNGAVGKTLGYYGPNETQPQYRRIRVSAKCEWVRVRYRRRQVDFVNDTDIVPIPSKQAVLMLLKAVRSMDTYNPDQADYFTQKAVEILTDIQCISDGPASFHLNLDPSFGLGSTDLR
jgi:hypothetical protein